MAALPGMVVRAPSSDDLDGTAGRRAPNPIIRRAARQDKYAN